MTPKNTIIHFSNKLDELNITNYTISHSSTSFGDSSYIYVAGLKIRASDHSTGITRMIEETPLFDFNFNEILTLIERLVFPSRFKKITTLKHGDVCEIKKTKLNTLTCEYKVHSDSYRVSKKGYVMSLISRRNVDVVEYVRNN